MAENNFKELSPCGALIMKIVWEAPGEISVQELIDQLNEKYQKAYARTTVVTFLSKLKIRGILIHIVKESRLILLCALLRMNTEERY